MIQGFSIWTASGLFSFRCFPPSPGMLSLRSNYRRQKSGPPEHQPSILHKTFSAYSEATGSSASLSAQSTFCSKIPVICPPEALAVTRKEIAADGLPALLCRRSRRQSDHSRGVSSGPGSSPLPPQTSNAPLVPRTPLCSPSGVPRLQADAQRPPSEAPARLGPVPGARLAPLPSRRRRRAALRPGARAERSHSFRRALVIGAVTSAPGRGALHPPASPARPRPHRRAPRTAPRGRGSRARGSAPAASRSSSAATATSARPWSESESRGRPAAPPLARRPSSRDPEPETWHRKSFGPASAGRAGPRAPPRSGARGRPGPARQRPGKARWGELGPFAPCRPLGPGETSRDLPRGRAVSPIPSPRSRELVAPAARAEMHFSGPGC